MVHDTLHQLRPSGTIFIYRLPVRQQRQIGTVCPSRISFLSGSFDFDTARLTRLFPF